MRKVILYIAQSLDGYIAGPNNELDWLMSLPNPNNTDHGYNAFYKSTDAAIMGRGTFNVVDGFDEPWPYKGKMSYVVTSLVPDSNENPDLKFISEDLVTFVKDLQNQPGKDIWLIGGGKLISSFLNLNLLDTMIISMIPKIIGDGIPLFDGKPKASDWKLVDSQSFDTGVVNLHYERIDE